MANIKKIIATTHPSDLLYFMVRRQSDGYYMEGLGGYAGSFVQTPTSPYTPMSEDAVMKGTYIVGENRSVWQTDFYEVMVYKQLGTLPVPATDVFVASRGMVVTNDVIIDPN